MQERYKYEFFKYIYDKLKLSTIEMELETKGIVYIDEEIDGLYQDLSKYFSLVNNVDTSRLTEDMKKKYEYYFSLSSEEITNKNLQDELNQFLENSYKLLLFPNIEENFCFYGPLNYKYVAPRDCVVLGFNYFEFDIPDNNFEELHSQREDFICDLLNYIQENLAKQVGINVAVLKYNEFSKKKSRVI